MGRWGHWRNSRGDRKEQPISKRRYAKLQKAYYESDEYRDYQAKVLVDKALENALPFKPMDFNMCLFLLSMTRRTYLTGLYLLTNKKG